MMMPFQMRRMPSQAPGKREPGFSLLELVIVLAIMMSISVVAIPLIANTTKQYRLREAGVDYANLLQQARVRAIQDDKYYTVLTALNSSTGGYYAYIDLAGSSTYASPDPMIVFSVGVIPQAFNSGPALSNLESQFLPAGASSINSVATAAAGPTFGPRGLPCTTQAVGGSGGLGSGTACPYVPPTSFITFFQSSQTSVWEAVTVTPAARIREWSSSDSSTWSPLN